MGTRKKITKPSDQSRARGGSEPQYTPEEVIQALTESRGILSAAARRLGCCRNTVKKYIGEFEEVKEAYDQEREMLGDEWEGSLLRISRKKKHRDHFSAVRYGLRTLFRDRGFGDHVDHSIDFEMPTGFEITIVNAPRDEDEKT